MPKIDPAYKMEILYKVLENRDLWLIRTILDNGVDVNLRLKKDRTLLMLAAHHRHPAMIQELIKRGAKTDMTDSAGRTAIDFAGDDSYLKELISKLAQRSNEKPGSI